MGPRNHKTTRNLTPLPYMENLKTKKQTEMAFNTKDDLIRAKAEIITRLMIIIGNLKQEDGHRGY